ncbi:MAG: S8 family serine peptidase [Candidatus Geothermarchaeales archaeon]
MFGVNGSDVVIAVLDTGVDLAHPDIDQARDDTGVPTSLGVTGVGVALGSLDLEPVGNVLPTAGRNITIYIGGGPLPEGHYVYTLGADIAISGEQLAESKSGRLRVGAHFFWDSALGGYYNVTMVMSDTVVAGVYDTVYFDLSSFYGLLMKIAVEVGFPNTLGLDPDALMDNSVVDEAPHRWGDGTEAVARDFNSDDIPDISTGTLAWTFDDQREGGEGLIPGLGAVDEDNAELFNVTGFGIPLQEWSLVSIHWPFANNHGTSVAGAAASSGEHEFFFTGFENDRTSLPGMAKGASVMSVNIQEPTGTLSTSGIIRGWFWAAGLDPLEVGLSEYSYDASRHADIISNSFGGSPFPATVPGVDLLDIIANLLSIPGYLDEAYPGSIMVVAAGNDGYGYGTIGSPGASTLSITAGASTQWLYLGRWNQTARPLQTTGFDEIASFSAKGPLPTGEIKPDVLAIGSFAIGLTAVNYWWANLWGIVGNGFYGTTIFGGTSQATPMVSGAAAVVVQAFKANGLTPTPQLVKSILMSSARDLGHDPFSQGAGRVDVFRAVSVVFEIADNEVAGQLMPPLVTSTSTYGKVREIQNRLHASEFSPLPDISLESSSVFAGRIPLGSSSTFEVSISSFMDGEQDVVVTPTRLTKIKEYSDILEADFSLQPLLTLPNGTVSEEGALYVLNLTRFVADQGGSLSQILEADLLSIFLAYDQALHLGEVLPFVYLVDWIDVDADGVFDWQTEQVRVMSDVRAAAVYTVASGHPATDFAGTPAIVLWSVLDPSLENITFKLIVQTFVRTAWDELSVQTIEGNPTTFQATVGIAVPADASPGFYEGVLEISVTNGTLTETVRTPVSYSAVRRLPNPGEIVQFGGEPSVMNTAYENFIILGGADSGDWSFGDFRFYPLEVDDPAAEDLVVSVSWLGELTQVDVLIVSPDETVALTSPIAFTGGIPNYLYSTTTDQARQVLVAPLDSQGVYTVVVHNTVSQGQTLFPDAVTLKATYTSERTMSLLIQPESERERPGLLGRGWAYGDLGVELDVSDQARALARVLGLTLTSGESVDRTGRVTADDSEFTAPWGSVKPHVNETIFIDVNELVIAKLDWTGADDVDLIPYDPEGNEVLAPDGTPAYEDSSTLARPERTEFTTTVAGEYTFVILLFDPLVDTDYDLSVAIGALSFSSPSGDPSRVLVDTEELPDTKDILFLLDVGGFVFDEGKYSTSFRLSIDNHPPRVTLTGVEDDEFVLETRTVRVSARDTFLASAVFSVDDTEVELTGGVTSRQILDLEDGDHVLRVRATDELGFVSEIEVVIHADRSTPTMAIVGGIVADSFVEGVLRVEAETRRLYLERITMSIDGGEATQVPPPEGIDITQAGSVTVSFSFDTGEFDDGEHSMTLVSHYLSGKNASRTINFKIDNNPPSLTVTDIPEKEHINSDARLEIGSSDVFLANVTLVVNQRGVDITGEGVVSLFDHLPTPPDGSYDVQVVSYDEAGHFTLTEFSVLVDTMLPQAEILSPESEAELQGVTVVRFLVVDANIERATLTISGEVFDVKGREFLTWDTGQLPDAQYTLVLEVIDKAGNTVQTAVTVSTINSFILVTYAAAAGAVVVVAVLAALLFLRRRRAARRNAVS